MSNNINSSINKSDKDTIRHLAGIGQIVRTQRIAQHLSQAQLAARVDSTQSQISQFEKGYSSAVSDEVARKIAHLLEIDFSLISGGRMGEQQCAVCMNADCFGALFCLVGNEATVRPMLWRVNAKAASEAKCRFCGDVIACTCEGCGASVQPGVFCSCGRPYLQCPSEINDLPPEAKIARIDQLNRRNSAFAILPGVSDLPLLK